jgi:hypothetical protein
VFNIPKVGQENNLEGNTKVFAFSRADFLNAAFLFARIYGQIKTSQKIHCSS